MNRNPLVPYALIAVLGIGLMLFLSFKGLGDAEKIALGEEEPQEEVVQSPEEIYNGSCIGCHGGNYEGVAGPALLGVGDKLDLDQIKDILANGKGTMPPGLVPADQLDAMAEWLTTLK
ncbi:cytochrome c550 [Bacillus sp. SCS-151]|uniref:cytochrome c550 n=1 Tax=Nanhaiella sioensis TaxID=3115293 RepID=UPI00397C06E3